MTSRSGLIEGMALPNRGRPEMSDRGWMACAKRLGERMACRIEGPTCTGEGWSVAITPLDGVTRPFSAPTMAALIDLVEGDL